MTPTQFRRIALSLPEAVEASHMGTADFRVGGKIFATLGNPDAEWGVVALTPDQQALLTATSPAMFVPIPGAWGQRGWTRIRLAPADAAALKRAMTMAWGARAPKAPLRRSKEKPAARKTSKATKASSSSVDRISSRVKKAIKASKLPGIEEGTHYGYPSMKAGGKFMMRIKDADTLVFSCPLEEKAMLMEVAPDIYHETDHYKGWPAVLVRVSAIGDAELAHRIRKAWEFVAPKKLMAELKSPAITKTSKRAKKRWTRA